MDGTEIVIRKYLEKLYQQYFGLIQIGETQS